MKTYAEYVNPYIVETRADGKQYASVPVVVISDEKRKKVTDFVTRFAEAKAKEEVHQSDPTNRMKRFGTGFLCEAGVEQFLGADFMDTTIGNSKNYAVADMAPIGVNAGVKGGIYENNKFIAINRNLRHPQVICFLTADRRRVFICGLATVDVLRRYSDDDLIMTKDMSGRKTGFYGFQHLIKFRSLEELRKLAPLS
jgi:hypothetical protein